MQHQITITTSYQEDRRMQTAITDKQRTFIMSLLDERDVPDAAAAEIRRRVQSYDVTRQRASEWIERLLAKPKRDTGRNGHIAPWRTINMQDSTDEAPLWVMLRSTDDDNVVVPRGSYAIPTAALYGTRTNEWNFYSVWISDDGERWSVKHIVSDERIKLPRSEQYKVLEVISGNPAQAATDYGHLIGKCGICGRTLTNDESRDRGIGPVCAARWGW